MATAKKKTTTKPRTTSKKAPARRTLPLYKPRNPENHKISGKFTRLYVLFAIATLIFAAISAALFMIAIESTDRVEKLQNEVTSIRNEQRKGICLEDDEEDCVVEEDWVEEE
jgi:hypothetical protein